MQVVGEVESDSRVVSQTKGEVHDSKLIKNMYFHSDLLQLCWKKKRKITDFFPDTTIFYDLKTCVVN